MRLEGKVALISGGSRGQGATEAELFVKEGAKVVIADILEPEGNAVAAQIREGGGDASFIKLDVTSEDDWRDAVEFTLNTYGKLDILINNAAIYKRTPIVQTDLDEWNRIMDINSTGVFLGTKLCVPAMQKSGGGSIINISSTAGLVGSERGSAYGASKGSVRLVHQVHRDSARGRRHPRQLHTPRPDRHRDDSGQHIHAGGQGAVRGARAARTHRNGDGRGLWRAVPGVRRILVYDRLGACH